MRVDPDNPLPVTKGSEFKDVIQELVKLAGMAPFHYESPEKQRSEKLTGKEPWRLHALDSSACRTLLGYFKEDKPMKASDGIKQMLAAADALILTTWLPEPSRRPGRKFHPNVKNMEHIAATGAAIQNLLLAATERKISNYWSSGGCLRKPKVLDFLGIPRQEVVLGAIFLFPDLESATIEKKPGKHRENRSDAGQWMDWVTLS